ncbi:hypothetical protein TNCV_4122531 [Trichonephila clavipes]|nr:hypothetical protein TNCV_4122531 [Trichonephila clavipes]
MDRTRWTCFVTSKLPIPQFLGFLFWMPQKSFVFKTLIVSEENLVARIVIASADITSTPDLFERFLQSFVRWCRLCYGLHGLNFEQFL